MLAILSNMSAALASNIKEIDKYGENVLMRIYSVCFGVYLPCRIYYSQRSSFFFAYREINICLEGKKRELLVVFISLRSLSSAGENLQKFIKYNAT